MLETVLSCDCNCGCKCTWKIEGYASDVWRQTVRRYGWSVSSQRKCPTCRDLCVKAESVKLTWREISHLLTLLNRYEDRVTGFYVSKAMLTAPKVNCDLLVYLDNALTSKLRADAKEKEKEVADQLPGGHFQITCAFAPRNDRPS